MNTRVTLHPKRRRFDTILYTAVALILAALVIDGVFGAHGLIATYRLHLQVGQTRQKIQQLDRENQEFTKQAQQLKSDPSAIERVARERMGLVKPGELVFKVPPNPASKANTTQGQPTGTSPSSSPNSASKP